ncbi:MAG: TldD/PmbA family protein [Candidatus Micrarchaeota archaeon]|nr:TldD/PmbA family protein [Candidatus Micrarchaeota archaeon]
MHEELADFAVGYSVRKGADYAEARAEHSEGESFSMKNGMLHAAGFEKEDGIGIRIIIGGAMQFISTNELSKKKLKGMIDKALRAGRNSAKIASKIDMSDVPVERQKYEVEQKVKSNEVDSRGKMGELFEIEDELKESKLNIAARFLSLSDEAVGKCFVNSEGSRISSLIPHVDFHSLITVVEGGQTAQRTVQLSETGGWEIVKGWNLPAKLLEEAKALSNNLKYGKPAPKGKVDVVAAPEVVGIAMHESVGHPYEADRILGREAAQAGESFMTPDMVGRRIAKEFVDVVDEPAVPGSAGYFLFDDEGVRARRKYLIKKGVINELLHNRETAFSLNTKSNGSARAMNYACEPIVRMSNTFLLPGELSEEEIIEDIKFGVYMKSFMEWNIDDKRVNERYVGSEAYLIEKGEITSPVKRPVIETTTFDFFSSIAAVGDKVGYYAGTCGKGEPSQGVPVWMGGPVVKLAGIRLG